MALEVGLMTLASRNAARLLLATAIALPLAACVAQETPPTQPGVNDVRPAGAGAVAGGDGSRPQLDDPSGLLTGKVGGLKPPPPPLAAAATASGQELGQDLAIALNADQDLDAYVLAFDKGGASIVASGAGNIVAQGAGNIVAQGAGNYALLQTSSSKLGTESEATVQPKPSPTGNLQAKEPSPAPKESPRPGASPLPADKPPADGKPQPGGPQPDRGASGEPRPAAAPKPLKPGEPLPSLAPRFKPDVAALETADTRDRVVAADLLHRNQKAERLQEMPEAPALRKVIKEAAWAANGDGTLTKTVEAKVERKLGGKPVQVQASLEATVDDASDMMVHNVARLVAANEKGSRESTREAVLKSDGQRHVTFHLEEVDARGRTRVVDWTKTIDLDGNVKGSGSFTRRGADGQVLRSATLELSGDGDAPLLRAVDANTKLEARISADKDKKFKVEVRDPVTSGVAELSVSGDVAPAEEAAALDAAATTDANATP